MRILLDTNVLASAAVARGLCADALREVLAEHELIVCPQILSELRRILHGKFRMQSELIEAFVRFLQRDTICVTPIELPSINLNDKDDWGILASAKSGNAHVIVTGDKELQSVRLFSGIKIVSPREFWKQLTG